MIDLSTDRQYRNSLGALLVIKDGRLYYVIEGGEGRLSYLVDVDSDDLAIPLLNVSGAVQIIPEGLMWRGWLYVPLAEPFKGEIIPQEEDDRSPRLAKHFVIGDRDGYILYISTSAGSPELSSGYRLYAGKADPDGDVIPRIDIRHCEPMGDGSTKMKTRIGRVNTGDGTWHPLLLEAYDIVETPEEVRFTRK